MEKLENILQTVCEARRPANGSEPVPDGRVHLPADGSGQDRSCHSDP